MRCLCRRRTIRNTGKPYGGRSPFEKLARPDRFFYAESRFAGWNTPLYDSNTVLVDFDADDRGYLAGRTSLGLTLPTYTDASLAGIKIKAAHLNEMLDLMR